jgi:hypothetical protein
MEKSEIENSLNEISALIEEMLLTPEGTRIVVYRKIDRHFRGIEATLALCPNEAALEALDELKVHLIALARLDDPDELTDEQHYEGAKENLGELRGEFCFGIGF